MTYDFNSQGQDLREEDYTQFNSAPSTNWEFYTTEEGAIQKITLLNNPSLSFQNLSKGKITLEIWVSNHGTNPNGYSVIDNSKAYLKVPFNVNPNNDNKLYLKPQSDNAYNSQLVQNLNSSQKNDSLKTQSFQVINNLNNGVLFTTGEHNYAAFGPVGTTWEIDNENWVLKSNLTGKGYFSIALLPDESSDSTKRDSLFQTFSQYASSFLNSDSGTQVSWQYDKGMQVLKTTYDFQFDQKDSKAGVNSTLIALYPHHWDSLPKGQFEELGTYKSPRGTLHLIDLSASNNKFVTELPFSGIIPALPMSDFWSQEEVQNIYNDILWACQISQNEQSKDCNIYAQISSNQNTYGEGKSFLMYAELANLTDELNKYYRRTGDTKKASNTLRYRNSILERLEARLEDWFTFKSINDPYFYYDKQFSTFIGYPSGFGSSNEINDHMFHYGYFVHAAAIVARYDEDWKNKWAPNINMLIHDFANHQRSNSGNFKDTPTPFLRNFDVYEGHAWASGHANNDLGNNEESSSESMNAFAGIALWGSETGDEIIRDLGIYLFTTGVQSLNYYHFDMQNKVFPSEYSHTMCSRIFGSGCDYETFFGVTPLYGHGMNFMPFTSTSVYLGSNSTYTQTNFNSLKLELGDKDGNIPFDDATAPWGIINAEQLSMANPKEAFIIVNSIWGKKPTWAYLTDGGDSKAHAEAFIGAMSHLGQLSENRSWQPDTANFLSFNKEGHITEILYNSSKETKTFKFSNGNTVTLKSHEIATNINKMLPLDFIPYSQDKTVVKEGSVKDEL